MPSGPMSSPYIPPLYAGVPFEINNSTDVIPSAFPMVLLKSNIGSLSMSGTPVIAAGIRIGQRLTLMVDDTSTGSITIGSSAGLDMIVTPLTLTHYGSFEEAMELVWTGSSWKSSSSAASNPSQGPYLGDRLVNTLFLPESIIFNAIIDIIDPGAASLASSARFGNNYILTVDLDIINTPSIDPGTDGQLLWIHNDITSTNTLTLTDDATLVGSTLELKTAAVILAPKDSILFVYYQGFWHEMARTVA